MGRRYSYKFDVHRAVHRNIESESLARGPKLLSIKNYIIEVMT